jgi:hypothetical protein
VDSGASHHLCMNADVMFNLRSCDLSSVKVANGASAQIVAVGDVHLQIGHRRVMAFVIRDVLRVPGLSVNLLSVCRLTGQGVSVLFNDKACFLQQNDVNFTLGVRKGGVFRLIGQPVVGSARKDARAALVTAGGEKEQVHLLHRRFGHLGYKYLSRLVKQGMVEGLDLPSGAIVQGTAADCEVRQRLRTKLPSKMSPSQNTHVLQLLHTGHM